MSNILTNELNCSFEKPSSSLWQATAVEAPNTETLTAEVDTDVVIVGGGITGLSTAIHLAEQGITVVVLEALNIGEGASGQNGGQVIPGLKHPPRKLSKIFGVQRGSEISNAAQNTADYTFELIERYQMNCQPVRNGWIKACHDQNALKEAHVDANELIALGAPVEILDANDIEQLIGSKTFVGGYIDKRAGSLQPLSYTYELCRIAQSLGVAVYSNTNIDSITEKKNNNSQIKQWQLTSDQQILNANKVVLATNAKTGDLWPKLRKTVFPMNSFQIATKPLSDELLEQILPKNHVVSDSHHMLSYFRRDSLGRFIIGGEGGLKGVPTLKDALNIKKSINRFFPQLKDIESEFIWSGQVAVTDDYLPRLSNPATGLFSAIGFNGRGVALATVMGKYLANLVTGCPANDIPFPITSIKPVPFHYFYKIGASAAMAGMRIVDKRADKKMDALLAKNNSEL